MTGAQCAVAFPPYSDCFRNRLLRCSKTYAPRAKTRPSAKLRRTADFLHLEARHRMACVWYRWRANRQLGASRMRFEFAAGVTNVMPSSRKNNAPKPRPPVTLRPVTAGPIAAPVRKGPHSKHSHGPRMQVLLMPVLRTSLSRKAGPAARPGDAATFIRRL